MEDPRFALKSIVLLVVIKLLNKRMRDSPVDRRSFWTSDCLALLKSILEFLSQWLLFGKGFSFVFDSLLVLLLILGPGWSEKHNLSAYEYSRDDSYKDGFIYYNSEN